MDEFGEISASTFILVDDHILLSLGIAEILKAISPGSSIRSFSTIEKATKALQADNYDFMLLDVLIPNEDSGAFVQYCSSNFPHMIIIVLTSIVDTHTIKKYLKMGANAYLSKSISLEEMAKTLKETRLGNTYISNDLASKLANSFLSLEKSPLTKKEIEVIALIANGKNVLYIADALCISSGTVMTHRRNIMLKLGLHSAVELVKYAYDNNLV